MAFLLFLIIGCFAEFSAGSEPQVPFCDRTIISKIEAYWRENGGAPRGILNTYIEGGMEFAFASTVRYFQYDMLCAYYIDYSPDNGVYRTSVHMYYNDRAPTTADISAYEHNGVTTVNGGEMLGHHVFVKNGVSCMYTCSKGPNALHNLPHAAVIKMRKDNPDHAAAHKCIGLLNSWGININRFYSDSCTENAHNAPHYHGHNIEFTPNYHGHNIEFMPNYHGHNIEFTPNYHGHNIDFFNNMYPHF